MNALKAVIAELQLIVALHAVNDKDARIKKLFADAQAELEKAAKSFGGQDDGFGNEIVR